MEEAAIVEFNDLVTGRRIELEVPLDITANDLVVALNESYHLGMDVKDNYSCYLIAENPICFLRGNKTLKAFGIHNGSLIIHKGN